MTIVEGVGWVLLHFVWEGSRSLDTAVDRGRCILLRPSA
jgi:hypothetical protein